MNDEIQGQIRDLQRRVSEIESDLKLFRYMLAQPGPLQSWWVQVVVALVVALTVFAMTLYLSGFHS